MRRDAWLVRTSLCLASIVAVAVSGCSGSDTESEGSGPDDAASGAAASPNTPTTSDDGTGGAATPSGGSANTGGASQDPPSSGGSVSTGGAPAGDADPPPTGGTGGSGGREATGGTTTATGGRSASGGASASSASGGAAAGGDTSCTEEELNFSFFATSLEGLRRESGSDDGFGGDLGGIAGADAICQKLAEFSTPCASKRQWRAFLSTVAGPVHAKDRIGTGPWYDRVGRIVALTLTDLINTRPVGADPEIANDLPNEFGIPNHDPDGTGAVDNHDFLTGTAEDGTLYSTDAGFTCEDWTSAAEAGSPHCGHTWPRGGGGGGRAGGGGGGMESWISALTEAGCAPADTATSLIESGGPKPNIKTVGSGGGYGGFYCFALAP